MRAKLPREYYTTHVNRQFCGVRRNSMGRRAADKLSLQQIWIRRKFGRRTGRYGVCYTRADEQPAKEIVSCGCNGAHLSGVLRPDDENECAQRHADKSAVSIQQNSAANSERLPTGVSGDRVRSVGA